MTSRTLSAAAFVVLCLALSGLILRRQMAAHPVPHTQPGQERGDAQSPFFSSLPNRGGWHVAAESTRKAVTASIQGQLDALRDGDGPKAVSYQSLGLRRSFGSPQGFIDGIRRGYPEFGYCRAARFGPVWTDKTARFAEVDVTVQGEDGRTAQGDYQMVREAGGYRVAGVLGGRAVRPDRLAPP